MQKLLITFGTRPLAQRLSKMLNNTFQIQFATAEEVPSFLAANYNKIPTGINPTYAHELLKLCLDKEIDFILPLGLSEIQTLAEAQVLFEEYGVEVLSPDKEFLEEIFVLENPSSGVELSVLFNGKSLNNKSDVDQVISGLFTISDEGDDLALCTI